MPTPVPLARRHVTGLARHVMVGVPDQAARDGAHRLGLDHERPSLPLEIDITRLLDHLAEGLRRHGMVALTIATLALRGRRGETHGDRGRAHALGRGEIRHSSRRVEPGRVDDRRQSPPQAGRDDSIEEIESVLGGDEIEFVLANDASQRIRADDLLGSEVLGCPGALPRRRRPHEHHEAGRRNGPAHHERTVEPRRRQRFAGAGTRQIVMCGGRDAANQTGAGREPRWRRPGRTPVSSPFSTVTRPRLIVAT